MAPGAERSSTGSAGQQGRLLGPQGDNLVLDIACRSVTVSSAMQEDAHDQAVVMIALRQRLRMLSNERDALVKRAQGLEAALAATSAEAQRRAAEALHLQALIDFYEQELPPDVSDAGEAAELRPDRAEQDDTAEGTSAGSIRRAGQAWTTAWRDAAVAALQDAGGPLHYRELYRLLAARGFTFGGRSPEATFLASLHRSRTTFETAGKGTYRLAGTVAGNSPAPAARNRRRTRRPRPIGKSRAGA